MHHLNSTCEPEYREYSNEELDAIIEKSVRRKLIKMISKQGFPDPEVICEYILRSF